MGCSSIEAYNLMCAEASICVDWRNATKGVCGKTELFFLVFFLTIMF